MSIDLPMPDAHQSMAIGRWIADLEAMPGVSEVLGWQVIDRDEFLGDEEPPAPEGICVEIRFRRRGQDPSLWHRLQVGPIAPAGADAGRRRPARPGPSPGGGDTPDCPAMFRHCPGFRAT